VTPPDVLLIVLAIIASYTDVRTRKIKNWLTFPMMAAGIVLAIPYQHHPWDGLLGVGAAMIVCLPLSQVGPVLSMGDVKMIMAAGALLGPEAAIRITLFSVALILPVAIVVLVARQRLGRVLDVLKGKEAPTMMFHAPVISVAILLARIQPLPVLFPGY